MVVIFEKFQNNVGRYLKNRKILKQFSEILVNLKKISVTPGKTFKSLKKSSRIILEKNSYTFLQQNFEYLNVTNFREI